MKIVLRDGEPCRLHKACASHLTKPCEGCGRKGAKGEVTIIRKRSNIKRFD